MSIQNRDCAYLSRWHRLAVAALGVLLVLAGPSTAAPTGPFTIHRSSSAVDVRSSASVATTGVGPYDDADGTLSDGQIYYYVVKDGSGNDVELSVHKNPMVDAVRLGFDDGGPATAPVDVALTSVTVSPASIPADGVSTILVTITPRDGDGVPLGSGLTISIDAEDLLPGDLGPLTDEGDGTYTARVTSTVPGAAVVRVTAEALFVTDEPPVNYEFTAPSVCGDGFVDPAKGEECDDANASDTDACLTSCVAAVCGDGVIWFGVEDCDDAGESPYCDADCTDSQCGDGTVNATFGEQCDDAGESTGCNADCTLASCGDGLVNGAAGEACDDGGPSAYCDAGCQYRNHIMVYGEQGSTTPVAREHDGTSWLAESPLGDVGGTPVWTVVRRSPTRVETVAVIVDAEHDLNALVHDGTAWSAPEELNADVRVSDRRIFDVAYEQLSGDALLVHREKMFRDPRYRVWDGAAWSAEATVTSPASGRLSWIRMAARPGSDEILLVALDDDDDLYAWVWNGDAFGPAELLETAGATHLAEMVDVVYDATGNAIVVWAEAGNSAPQFRIWDGTEWLTEGNATDIGAAAQWVRLAADPASGQVLLATLGSDSRLQVQTRSGQAWGETTVIETAPAAVDRPSFGLAYAPGGGDALLVWGRAGSNTPMYRDWSGGAWSLVRTGPDLGGTPSVVQLQPTASAGGIHVGVLSASSGNLHVALWNGSTVEAATLLEVDVSSGDLVEAFMSDGP